MNEQANSKTIKIETTRFGTLEVDAESFIIIPSGLIGFPEKQRFIMLDHKYPFSWLQSIDDPNLAFVVVDGSEFGDNYCQIKPPDDKDLALLDDDEYAILVIVTVRKESSLTTANLKAPIIVNLRNRQGVQAIYDHPELSTRFSLWEQDEAKSDVGIKQAEKIQSNKKIK